MRKVGDLNGKLHVIATQKTPGAYGENKRTEPMTAELGNTTTG